MIKWFEILASDIDRAVKFYSELLNVEFEICDCGSEKMAFFPDKVGAISQAEGFLPSRQGTIIYFDAIKPLAEMAKLAQKLGGSIDWDVTKIKAEDAGSFILVIDTEGNRIGIHANE